MEEFSRGHKKVQIPREASNSAHSSPITVFSFNLGLGADRSPSCTRPASIRHFQQSARLPRCGLYAWRLSPPGCKYPKSHGSWVSQQFLHYFQIRSHGPKQCGVRVPEGMPSDALADPQLLDNRTDVSAHQLLSPVRIFSAATRTGKHPMLRLLVGVLLAPALQASIRSS